MIVIRRMVDRRRAYTAIFLKGEPPKIFPTSDAEHARILQVYKQDRPHEGILNDFAETDFPPPTTSTTLPPSPHPSPPPWPQPASPTRPSKKTPHPPARASKRPTTSALAPPKSAAPLWLVLAAPPTMPARP